MIVLLIKQLYIDAKLIIREHWIKDWFSYIMKQHERVSASSGGGCTVSKKSFRLQSISIVVLYRQLNRQPVGFIPLALNMHSKLLRSMVRQKGAGWQQSGYANVTPFILVGSILFLLHVRSLLNRQMPLLTAQQPIRYSFIKSNIFTSISSMNG